MSTCNISVAIPTYNRVEKLLETLEWINACNPKPDEIIVHTDGNDMVTETAIQASRFQDVIVIKNSVQVGPGGGRNIAIAQAKNPIVASFDDDSYPIDSDYFHRLQTLFDSFPEAAVVAAAIFHINETVEPDEPIATWNADFVGCGCAYRRDVFLKTTGYVCLPCAYGMEEVDLSLRLYDMGWRVLKSPWLRVFHNTQLTHHSSSKVTAASIANQFLLTYLRYPFRFWWLGIGQCFSRIVWLIRHRRLTGILQGIVDIPGLVWRHRQQRQAVAVQSFLNVRALRQTPITADFESDRWHELKRSLHPMQDIHPESCGTT